MGLRIFCISRDKFTCFFSLNIGIGNEIVLDRLFPKGEIEQFNKNGNKFGLFLWYSLVFYNTLIFAFRYIVLGK